MPRGGKRSGAGRKSLDNKDILIVPESKTIKEPPSVPAAPIRLVPSPLNGVIPPVEHRIKPGEVRNPLGRPPNAGLSVVEYINNLAALDLTEDEIRAVARDRKATWAKRTAAERMLRTMEAGDLADMEELCDGTKSLRQLRTEGVNTEVIKKIKVKRRTLFNQDGPEGEEVEREIELHDRSGVDFDRIIDRTQGKAKQAIEVEGTVQIVAVKIVTPMTSAVGDDT